MTTTIQEHLTSVIHEIQSNTHIRYKSWEHCYRYFDPDNQQYEKDKAALHLAFYLASWGMYRGSSSLLSLDYKIFYNIIDALEESKYKNLRALSIPETKVYLNTLFELKEALKTLLKDFEVTPTDNTLVTKIILGVLGCVPAYDNLFQEGLKYHQIPYSNFTQNSFQKLVNWAYQNKTEIHKVEQQTQEKLEIAYPDWKIVDMYFWEFGRQIQDNKATK